MAKKNNKEQEMHDHMMMHHNKRKGQGVVSIVIGLVVLYAAYTYNPVMTITLVGLGVAAVFLGGGLLKLGIDYGFGCNCGCGCGCGCEGECDCEMDHKN